MNPEIKRRIEQIRRGDVPEEYKKAIVGNIPDSWGPKQLKDICEINPPERISNRHRPPFLECQTLTTVAILQLSTKWIYTRSKAALPLLKEVIFSLLKSLLALKTGKAPTPKRFKPKQVLAALNFMFYETKKMVILFFTTPFLTLFGLSKNEK